MKSSDAKASKCHLKFSSRMVIFIKHVYLSLVISLKWQLIGNLHCPLSEITELKYTSLVKMIILEENFKWHLEAFASELFIFNFYRDKDVAQLRVCVCMLLLADDTRSFLTNMLPW